MVSMGFFDAALMILDLQAIPSATTTNTVTNDHSRNIKVDIHRGEESNNSLTYIMTKHYFSVSHAQICFKLAAHIPFCHSLLLPSTVPPSLPPSLLMTPLRERGGEGAVNLIDSSVGLSN